MLVDKEALVPNSLSVPSRASFVVRVKSKEEICGVNNFAKKEGLPLIPLGDGTNILPHDYVKAVVAILDIKGINFRKFLEVGAGENWDNLIKLCVEKGFTGIEALSAIPGKVGAAPIQNIGAYGSEIADCIEKVEVYDREKEEFLFLDKKECQFQYRNSLFKKYRDKFIVVSLFLKLSKEKPKIPDYKDVKNYFGERGNDSPKLKEIREAIIEIRKKKLPDPSLVPNSGSFFSHPFVKKKLADKIKEEFPALPTFESGNLVKIPAGWLIEQAGLKGKKIGKVLISPHNALVLTNPNHATFEEVRNVEEIIKEKVFRKFGIYLVREPITI